MGGTSIDVSLIENGKASLSNERLVEGYPARIPMIDIVTVGAGGGSIARIDAGGAEGRPRQRRRHAGTGLLHEGRNRGPA